MTLEDATQETAYGVDVYTAATPEYVVPKSSPTINRSFKGAGSRIGPEIASVEDVGV